MDISVDSSIPLKVAVPDTMHTLGSMLDLRQKAQNYQTGAISQKRQGVALQQEQGDLDARKAVGAVVSDPQYKLPDGTFDLNSATPAIVQADPQNRVASQIISHLAGANNDLITVKKNALGLAGASRDLIGSTLGAMATRDDLTKNEMGTALTVLQQQAPDAQPAIDVWRKHLDTMPDDPKQLKQAAMMARSQVMPPSAQIESQTPAGPIQDTGGGSQMTNVKQTAGAIGPVPGTFVAHPAEQIVTDAQGNQYKAVKDPAGHMVLQPLQSQGFGGAGPSATTPPMTTLPPGESPQTRDMLGQERQAALQALSGAPLLHATNRGVLEEIDKTTTGSLGPRMADIMSKAGVALPKGWGQASAEEKASAYDLVGKYLERNAITAAQSMGPHTNAGLESQIKSQGSVAYNPTAIKKITQLNDALVSGSEHYQPGLEKAITSSPNQIFAKRQYDQQWAQNFDPRVMMIYNAQANGNPREVQDLIKGWGGKDSATVKEILRKAKNLDSLSTTGQVQ